MEQQICLNLVCKTTVSGRMLRDLLKEGGLYTVANLLTKGVSLLLIPFYTAYFTPEDYGVIDMLVVFGTIVTTIVSLQLNQGLGRYVSDSEIDQDEKNALGSTAVYFVLGAYIVVTLLLIIFSKSIIGWLSNDETTIPTTTFLLAIGAVSINGIFYFLGVYLRFLRKTKAYTLTSFGNAIFTILLTLYLVLKRDMGIDGIYLASLLVAPMMILIQLFFLREYLNSQFNNSHLKKLLKFSVPLVPAAVAYVVLNFIDRIFIKELLSFSEEGIYGIGSKFASIISIIILGFSAALGPILYQKHREEHVKKEMGRIFKIFFAIGTTGVLILSLFSTETLIIFTQEDYYSADLIMPVLYLSVLITGMGIFAHGLHLKEKTKIVPVIVISAAIINVILNYLLITKWALMGAAVATLIGIFLNNFLLFHQSQKYYKIEIPLLKMVGFSLLFFLFWGSGSYFNRYIDFNWITVICIKVVMVIAYFYFLVLGEMINLKHLKQDLSR
jgi:O-antigen/teichoic acid export membrane protein